MAAAGRPVGARAGPQSECAIAGLASDLGKPWERDVATNHEPERGIRRHALHRVARDDLGDEGGGFRERAEEG